MTGAEVFVQYKGTDICLDFYCQCGFQGHFDGYFAYRILCPSCGATWQLPTTLTLVPPEGEGSPPVTPRD